ncbi:hypothetical protein P8C59_000829 [Phyllachora maydis]|uniref:Uncharacterized protein n=1 Tax=Phyllachora maydis TaxID=1825666 RepID=A0AAD9HX38_9PEZI|nr:hypothetical protein P8C59_000829 [Phyllachora maydis]
MATPADHDAMAPSPRSPAEWSTGVLSPTEPGFSVTDRGYANVPSTAASTPMDSDRFTDRFPNFGRAPPPFAPPPPPSSSSSSSSCPDPDPARKWWHHVFGSWTWELLALFVAIGIQGAVIAILAHFDGETVPEWPFSINLNTLVALLSTMLRAAMLLVVTQTLGQIKWSWFIERVRPLQQLHDFDQASRSILGSLRLVLIILFRGGGTRAGALAFMAAMITIISFAIGPFTQQAIRTGSCSRFVQDTNASLPVAHVMPGTSSYFRIGAGRWELMVDMKAAMIQGLANPNRNDSAIQASCPTGNCTFSDHGTPFTHASIGMCSMCLDSTPAVTVQQKAYWKVLSLPDPDVNVTALEGYPWLNVRPSNLSWATSLPGWTPAFQAAARASIFNLSILALTAAPCSNATGTVVCPHNTSGEARPESAPATLDYVAASCSLYPCLRTYQAAVSAGLLQETVVQTTPAPLNTMEYAGAAGGAVAANYTAVLSPCMLDNSSTWYTEANMTSAPQAPGRTWGVAPLRVAPDRVVNATVPNACLYKVTQVYAMAMAAFMESTLFSDKCTYDLEQGGELQCPSAWWLPTAFFADSNATVGTLSASMDAFAAAVTRVFRNTGAGPDGQLGPTDPARLVLGRVVTTSVCTYFAWRWMMLPCALVAACALLLAWTVVRGWRDPRVPVWKGSVLPLLFYGLQGGGPAPATAPPPAPAAATTKTTGPRRPARNGEKSPLMRLGAVEDVASSLLVRFRPDTEPGFVGVASLRPRRPKTQYSMTMDSLFDEPRSPTKESHLRQHP